MSKKKRTSGRPIEMERKYQLLSLVHSGNMSLSDLKSQYRMTYVAATDEYSSKADQNKTLAAEARIQKLMRLTETRDMARQRAIMKMKPKPKLIGTRADAIAAFATGYTKDKGWSRYSPMVLIPKRYNPPRHGSSKGRIGKTEYIGFDEFNRDFDSMMKGLLNLTKKRGVQGKDIAKRLAGVKAGVNVVVKR